MGKVWKKIAAGRIGVLLVASVCCVTACNSDQEMPVFQTTDFPCARVVEETGLWESAPFPSATGELCPWSAYPGPGVITIGHSLGRVPSTVLVYLSFEEDGVPSTLAAGDLARILEVTETQLQVENGTEQDLFFRVVLW